MSRSILFLDAELFELLTVHDEAIAHQVAASGCSECHGPLYRGDYDRKPRGGVIAQEGEEFVAAVQPVLWAGGMPEAGDAAVAALPWAGGSTWARS